jgi:hypothetical protein
MSSLGEVNFIQGMLDFGNPKNSVGLKPLNRTSKGIPFLGYRGRNRDVYDFMLLLARV